MTERLSFEEAAQVLGRSFEETARLMLTGALDFEVNKRSSNPRTVISMDVWIPAAAIRRFRAAHHTLEDLARADDVINRAVLKFGKHPTRSSPGVRGPTRRREASCG